MQVITSKDNEIIKNIKKLKDKKYRDQEHKYIIEGIKLIEEAVKESAKINTVVVCEDCVKNEEIDSKLLYEVAKYNCIYVSEKIFSLITDVKNPQGILAVIEKEAEKEQIDYNEDLIVVLDKVQDPGNLGTILRTVDSIGLKQIIVAEGSGDIFNPKVVRSTMGAIFRVKVKISQDIEKTIAEIKKHKFKVVSTSLATDKSIYDIKYEKSAIIIGNEANGVSKELQEASDELVKIPMLGNTESLNASVATGIVLYEYVRQKLEK